MNSKFKISNYGQKGFTIIEVLVVSAVIILLSTILISNFPQAKLGFALSRTAYKFGQDVRRAQSDAFSSTPYQDSYGEQAISGYGIYVNASNNKEYILYADKSPGNQRYDNEDYVIEVVDIGISESGVMIKQVDGIAGDNVSINFAPPNPTTTISDGLGQEGSAVDIVFALESDLARSKTVSVNATGLIEVR